MAGKKTALEMDLPFLAKIPFDQDIVKCSDSGISYQKDFSKTEITKSFRLIANKMIDSIKT